MGTVMGKTVVVQQPAPVMMAPPVVAGPSMGEMIVGNVVGNVVGNAISNTIMPRGPSGTDQMLANQQRAEAPTSSAQCPPHDLILSKGEPPRRSIPGSERCLPDQGLGSPVESRALPFEVGSFPLIYSPPSGCSTSNGWQQWGHSCARVGAECVISCPPLREGRIACNRNCRFSDK